MSVRKKEKASTSEHMRPLFGVDLARTLTSTIAVEQLMLSGNGKQRLFHEKVLPADLCAAFVASWFLRAVCLTLAKGTLIH
jgi:hypothetical protein